MRAGSRLRPRPDRGSRRARGRGQAQHRLLRGVWLGRMGRPRAGPGRVPSGPVVILDAKRGDIGPPPIAMRTPSWVVSQADAVTLQPYLGEDAIEPFLAYPVACLRACPDRNPSAGQSRTFSQTDGARSRAIAPWVAAMDRRARRTGGRRHRAAVSCAAAGRRFRALGFLVPGVGAQGGDLTAAVRPATVRGAGPGERLAAASPMRRLAATGARQRRRRPSAGWATSEGGATLGVSHAPAHQEESPQYATSEGPSSSSSWWSC